MTAAITAFDRGKKVLIFERDQKVGSKILISGNGKCNLSATDVCPEKYNDPVFVRDILMKEDPVRFLEEKGVLRTLPESLRKKNEENESIDRGK